jgi:ABC-type multidrug transport system fused ATPase/permease subunit
MLQARHFIFPSILLVTTIYLMGHFPGLWWLWILLFLIFSTLAFLLGYFGRFMRLDRLLRQKQYKELEKICAPIWKETNNPALRRIAGLYLASCFIEGSTETVQHGNEILSQIDAQQLRPRFRNRYYLIKAQLELYQSQVTAALETLKKCSLYPLGNYYLGRLFYLFSLTFLLLQQETERGLNYAAKAFELQPAEPRCKAQYGVMLKLNGDTEQGNILLQQALTELPSQAHWERQLFEKYRI